MIPAPPRIRWLALGVLIACKGAGTAPPGALESDASALQVGDSAAASIGDASAIPPTPPVVVPTPSFDAGEAIGLYDGDRMLWVSFSGGMQRPCGKMKLAPPPSGRYAVDLMKGDVTLEVESKCGGAVTRRGRLGKGARAKLKELIAAMDAPSGKAATADGPTFMVTILRADAHVAMQGGRGSGDYAHDGNAADIADYLDRFLERPKTE
jgi:hypothetical protein